MFSKLKNFLIPLLLCLQLTSCVVINSVDAVKPADNFALTDDRALIFFSVNIEGSSQNQPVNNTQIRRFFPGSKKMSASCFFYSYSVATATVKSQDFGKRKYFAFKVLPGYYILDSTPIKFGVSSEAESHIAYKVEAKKINYLGDLTKTVITPESFDHHNMHAAVETVTIARDLPAAEKAAKDFRTLNWPVSQAEEKQMEGVVEPMPFCTL